VKIFASYAQARKFLVQKLGFELALIQTATIGRETFTRSSGLPRIFSRYNGRQMKGKAFKIQAFIDPIPNLKGGWTLRFQGADPFFNPRVARAKTVKNSSANPFAILAARLNLPNPGLTTGTLGLDTELYGRFDPASLTLTLELPEPNPETVALFANPTYGGPFGGITGWGRYVYDYHEKF
jgi:hypothetical protein